MSNVTVSLTFETEAPKDELLRKVLVAIADSPNLSAERAAVVSAHTYNDDDLNRTDEPTVHLVIDDADRAVVGFIGEPERARLYAEHEGGVVVELPIDVDCRSGR